MAEKIYPLVMDAGIQRDGTPFSTKKWTNGVNCRFQRNLPKKIGGYQQLFSVDPLYPVTGSIGVRSDQISLCYYGTSQGVFLNPLLKNGTSTGGSFDLTPDGYVPDPNSLWKFDTVYSTIANENNLKPNYIVAFPGINLESIDDPTERPVYYGVLGAADNLQYANISVSGGILVLSPYLIAYGNNGIINISTEEDPFDFKGETSLRRVCANTKIVAGLPLRGDSNTSGIFWSLNSVFRTSRGPDGSVSVNVISNNSSILSSRSVIEYNGIYFWAGCGTFMFYNGIVQDLPNDTNVNFFFDSIWPQNNQKVWAEKVPRYSEIWWHFCKDDSNIPNHAVIFNVEKKIWYDTPTAGRTSGYYETLFSKPVWFGRDAAYKHESGLNKINLNGTTQSVPFDISSSDLTFCAIGPSGNFTGVERNVYFRKIEPDFILNNNIGVTLDVTTKQYAQSEPFTAKTFELDNNTDYQSVDTQGRQISLRFHKDAIDFDFEMGSPLLDLTVGDGRP